MVYVLDVSGNPLTPTKRYGKARHLLETGKAVCVKRCPFTIQLTYQNAGPEPDGLSLGVDCGSKHIGLSISSEEQEYYSSEVELRQDITANLSTRREFRRARRHRKLRYRKPRFLNRTASKKKGWLAPSVRQKVESHLNRIDKAVKMLPIREIKVEVAAFDLQKLQADLKGLKRPKGEEYQQGPQLDFWNVREYVLFRDHHECQCCHGKSGDKVLNVHHLRSRKVGGDAPDNLITLCEYCHGQYHKGELELPESAKKPKPLRDAVFMGIMRWTLYNRLKEIYEPQGIKVKLTYGYITKHTRIENSLEEKSHRLDALCIAGHPKAKRCEEWFLQKKVRCHNRQLHKATIQKGGVRKANQLPAVVKGFRLYDKALYQNRECFIWGRRKTGYFTLKTLDGIMICDGVSSKKLTLLEKRKSYLTERRKQELCNSF